MGGGSGVVVEDLDVNEVYDPSTDSWSTRASLPSARVIRSKPYLTGRRAQKSLKARTTNSNEGFT